MSQSNDDMKPFRLDDLPKKTSGFTAPDNYFDSIENSVMHRLEMIADEKPETKVIPIHRNKRFWYAAAAVFVVGIGIGTFIKNDQPLHNDEVMENYLAYQTSINQFDLLTLLDTTDIREMHQEVSISDEALEEMINENPEFERILTE